MASTTYDYVIVGGGLAGCVVASRLYQYDETAKILLIEAGQDTRERDDVQNPQVLNLGGDLDWGYQTESMPGIFNRSITFNSGKGLGGGSSINSGKCLGPQSTGCNHMSIHSAHAGVRHQKVEEEEEEKS